VDGTEEAPLDTVEGGASADAVTDAIDEAVEEVHEEVQELAVITATAWVDLHERITALEAAGHVEPTETTEADDSTEEALPEEGSTEEIHPAGDPEETIVVNHRRKYRRV
jgi:hypothetical protein